MRTFGFVLWACLALCSWSSESSAASFDCTKAHTSVERAICANEDISKLDEQMAEAYRKRLGSLNRDEVAALRWGQQQWMAFLNRLCSLPDSQTDCLSDLYRDRIAALKQRCQIDKTHTLEDMAGWKTPWSDAIPNGFTLDDHIVLYVVRDRASAYNLPSVDIPAARKAGAILKNPYRDLALCRAQAPEGTWWLAERMRGGDLSYVLEADTEPAADYDARTKREMEERRKAAQKPEEPN